MSLMGHNQDLNRRASDQNRRIIRFTIRAKTAYERIIEAPMLALVKIDGNWELVSL